MLYQGMRGKRQAIILTLLFLAISGCSRKKTIDRDEARSEIRLADSFAAESQMFVDYLFPGRSTRSYAEGHAGYLEDAIAKEIKQLQQATPEPGVATAVSECLTELEQLRDQIAGIQKNLGDRNRLAQVRKTLLCIRENLARANSRL